MRILVLYHRNCSDGFGAAYAAWKHFGTEADYQPLLYGTPIGHITDGYDRVFFLDVVPQPYDSIFGIQSQVVVIDHHKTAGEAYWPKFPNVPKQFQYRGVEFNFDMAHSAAVLTHKYFNPGTVTPWLLEYVEDRDLWLHKQALSAEVNAAIRSYPFDFLVWDRFTTPRDMAKIGEHVLRTEKIYWERSLENVQIVPILGVNVPVVNTTVGGSDAANALLERRRVDVAGYYFDRGDGIRQWGLRGTGKVDVSDIAARLGGGGHARAAGFQTPLIDAVGTFRYAA